MLSSFKAEAKQEVAIEAANDPHSNFSAQDAQNVLVNESKKAGAPAFHFDPNATSAEKAAQAKASENALHTNRNKGAGLKSDINTGPDDYDLPTPTTSGAIAASTGDHQLDQATGAVHEEDQWRKTGWAPRFGTGETEEEKKDDALISDHQTLLESKIDDKFFGDWYHNAGIIVFSCLASWLVAVLGGGLAWVLIVMAACGTYYRTSIRRVRRNFRDDITRELAKARLETDHETLEWINSFMVKFWPIFAPNLAVSVIQSVDQILSTATPSFLDSMKMETFTLGTKPPRMEHVKTYPKADDDTVMMDWKFSFTPTDTMDMTVRQLKNRVNPKVVLEIRIGKAMVSKALKIIVEDFCFSGLMRIRMKLQLPFPYIERVDLCFLERPEIDYVCKPLGGETFGFDINFIPGLENFIKEQIHANLAPMMYAPNVFPIEVAKMLSGNAIDMAVGVVAITLHGAHGLRNPDNFSGTPDPYAVVSLDTRQELGRTKTVRENADPIWNETVYIIITNFTDSLTVQVYDYNEVRKDKQLGTATFPLERLQQLPEHNNEQIDIVAGGKQRGLLNCDIRFFPVLEGYKDEEGNELPPPESNTGIARITVEQAKDLDGSKSLVGQLNPYAELLLNGKVVYTTDKLKRTNNPIFAKPTTSVLVTDKRKARVGLVIKDDRDLSADPILGKYQIKLDDLLTLHQKGQEWFNLADSKTGRAKLMIDWKPVALSGITSSGGYITPIGVMRIHFKSANDLRNLETLGKSDPYARVLLNGIQKARTVTFKNNLAPTWDEVLYVPVHTTRERITLEVMDEEKLGKDRSLGLIEVALPEYIFDNTETGGYLVHDSKKVLNEGLRMAGKGAAKGNLTYTVSFFPTMNVIDPEEEKAEQEALPASPIRPEGSISSIKNSTDLGPRTNGIDATPRKSVETAGRLSVGHEARPRLSHDLKAPSVNGSYLSIKKEPPKIRVTAENLAKYETGLLVFQIVEGTFAHKNCHLEVVMDDHIFPSYSSSKARQRQHVFGETGDAMIRELEFSRITLRLVEKVDKEGDDGEEHTMAKLQGQTLEVLGRCLYQPTELNLKGDDGSVSTVIVNLKYLPIEMKLDPSESINNMGTLRVDVLDAAELPAADRNGFSDPYCKFKLNDKEIHKTKTQKKTLHPAWNETFETMISSRTAANFRVDVYDWDFGDKADYLGGAGIDLAALEPFEQREFRYILDGKSGVLRLKMTFKPAYVTRARQGSSTFHGTFAPAGKVVGAPVKGVTKLGGGVTKGASFIKRGFTIGKGSRDESAAVNGTTEFSTPETVSPSAPATPAKSVALSDANTPITPIPQHNRSPSYASTMQNAGPKGADSGTAQFIIVSASGFPDNADVQVHVNMKGAKGKTKELYKTKHLKPKGGIVEYGDNENFKVSCTADTIFQMVVKDHEVFRDKELGEGMFFVADQGNGSEQTVNVGSGSVIVRSSFTPNASASVTASGDGMLRPPTSGNDSPISRKDAPGRRSFFGKRDASGKVEAA